MSERAKELQSQYAEQRHDRGNYLGMIKSKFSWVPVEKVRTVNDRLRTYGYSGEFISCDSIVDGKLHVQKDPNFRSVADSMRTYLAIKVQEDHQNLSLEEHKKQSLDFIETYGELVLLRATAEVVAEDLAENPFRHCFISMMAGFDATVFDLAKIAMCLNFDHVTGLNNSSSLKIDFKDLGPAPESTTLHEYIAAAVLKRPYIRKLVNYLLEHFDYPDVDAELLRESLSRRNAFLHSASIADQKYCDDAEGNPFGIELGDKLSTEEQYLMEAEDRCEDFISAMADWIHQGAPSHST